MIVPSTLSVGCCRAWSSVGGTRVVLILAACQPSPSIVLSLRGQPVTTFWQSPVTVFLFYSSSALLYQWVATSQGQALGSPPPGLLQNSPIWFLLIRFPRYNRVRQWIFRNFQHLLMIQHLQGRQSSQLILQFLQQQRQLCVRCLWRVLWKRRRGRRNSTLFLQSWFFNQQEVK